MEHQRPDLVIDDLYNEYGELERELVELRKDKERLDALESRLTDINFPDTYTILSLPPGITGQKCHEIQISNSGGRYKGDDLRQAIDAAIESEETDDR